MVGGPSRVSRRPGLRSNQRVLGVRRNLAPGYGWRLPDDQPPERRAEVGHMGRGSTQARRCAGSNVRLPSPSTLDMAPLAQGVCMDRGRGDHPLRVRAHFSGTDGGGRHDSSGEDNRPACSGLARLPLGSLVPHLGSPRDHRIAPDSVRRSPVGHALGGVASPLPCSDKFSPGEKILRDTGDVQRRLLLARAEKSRILFPNALEMAVWSWQPRRSLGLIDRSDRGFNTSPFAPPNSSPRRGRSPRYDVPPPAGSINQQSMRRSETSTSEKLNELIGLPDAPSRSAHRC